MDESLNERINRLRERSRFFLAQVEANSKKVKELRKLYSQSLSSREGYKTHTDEPSLLNKRSIKSWKLRNDSKGVGAALCSDYFCNSPRQPSASMPNIPTTKKLLTSTKKHSENQCCLEHINRKPVKECYCNPNNRKIQLRSGRTQHKQRSPCKYHKSHTYTSAVTIEDNEKQLLTSPISCETLRRLQKIDYAPRSQFLRNVQSKVSLLQSTAAKGDCPEICSRSQYYHEFMSRQANPQDEKSERKNQLTNSESLPKMPITLEPSKSKSSELENVDRLSKGIQVSLKKQPKPKAVVKRTLSSKKSVPDLKKSSSKLSTKSKRISINKDCPCCHNNKSQYSKTTPENYVVSGDYQPTVCINKDQEEIDKEYLSDQEIRELRNFREQNYFDTHGSNHTLVSSKSSGSLEQYFLNDRLFPEAAKRIHKKDLVVTMPACATVQRKRIHYFPRYIVRQEKNNFNSNCKKKRYQSCPLTGHAIDLGITKIRSPLNSLALKYQKRLP